MSEAGHVTEQDGQDGQGAIAQHTTWEQRINSLVKTAQQQQQSRIDEQAKLNKQKKALQLQLQLLKTSYAKDNETIATQTKQQRKGLQQSFSAQKAKLQSTLKKLQAQHDQQKKKLVDQHEKQKHKMMAKNAVEYARAKTNAGRILQTLTSWLP